VKPKNIFNIKRLGKTEGEREGRNEDMGEGKARKYDKREREGEGCKVTSRCGLGGGHTAVVLPFSVAAAAVLLPLPVAAAAVLLPLPVILLTKRFSPLMRLDPKPAELTVSLLLGKLTAAWTASVRARKATAWCDVMSATDSPNCPEGPVMGLMC
jgi:hypothetical protein